jgi:acetyl-CoA C-acetyltransferase
MTRSFASQPLANDPVIVAYSRTPFGKFGGSMSQLTAPQLASEAIKSVLEKTGIDKNEIEEAIFGNVISAGVGQAPTKQAVIFSGLPDSIPCTTVNKVCASGMKAVMMASQAIMTGMRDVVLVGGMESMSNVPYYLPKARSGLRLGHGSVVDGVIHDGLWDVYDDQHMGMCGEVCATKYNFSREDQDGYAIDSYERSKKAWEDGVFAEEVISLSLPQRRGDPLVISQDEEFTNIKLDKVPGLRPAFKKDGTVTAANSSTLNDGGAALLVMSHQRAKDLGLNPLLRVVSFEDAAQAPVMFTTTPTLAVNKALDRAGMQVSDVDYHEINEAFSVVALANMQLMGLDHDRVNVNGGAVSLGHPIGVSGARITGTLSTVLKQKDASIGCASICNGGGGASAIIVERLN